MLGDYSGGVGDAVSFSDIRALIWGRRRDDPACLMNTVDRLSGEVEELKEERDRLQRALEKVAEKAGSHTVSMQQARRGKDNTGFAGIYAMASEALAHADFGSDHHD